jgi:hypothetical protein
VILRECLPDVKSLIRYAADTIPAVGHMMGLADRGTADLVKASTTLREVRASTERAVNEIFGIMDLVDPLLAKAARAEGSDDETRKALADARGQLTLILNALQFQDITSQQIEATNALLADLGRGLAVLMEGMGEKLEGGTQIEVRHGTFDPNASFDRNRADEDQASIDSLLDAGMAPSPDPGTKAAKPPAPPAGGNGSPRASATQDDIDALVGEASESVSKGTSPEAVSQDDIDALLK